MANYFYEEQTGDQNHKTHQIFYTDAHNLNLSGFVQTNLKAATETLDHAAYLQIIYQPLVTFFKLRNI